MSDREVSPQRLTAAADALLREPPDEDLVFKFTTEELEAAADFNRRMGMREPPKQKATKL